MEYLGEIITALGVVVMAWFTYNQRTKDKLTDLKIKEHEEHRRKEKIEYKTKYAQIYGLIWRLLVDMKCERVLILQPVPLNKSQVIVCSFCVEKNGITHIPDSTVYRISDFAGAVEKIATIDSHFYHSVTKETDGRARSVFYHFGIEKAAQVKLSTDSDSWIGNLICDLDVDLNWNERDVLEKMRVVADNLQYILPEREL